MITTVTADYEPGIKVTISRNVRHGGMITVDYQNHGPVTYRYRGVVDDNSPVSLGFGSKIIATLFCLDEYLLNALPQQVCLTEADYARVTYCIMVTCHMFVMRELPELKEQASKVSKASFIGIQGLRQTASLFNF